MKKILFGITSLTLGGAERVLVDLANKLCENYEITIFTIYANGELEKQLSKKVNLKTLYNKQYSELSNRERKIVPIKVLLNKKKIYNNYIKENYDVEISFLEGPITRLFGVRNNNTRKISWIHNDISLVFGNGLKAKLKRFMDKKVYLKYDTLVFVSKENLKNFNETYKILSNVKKEVIYNYIDANRIIEKAEEKSEIEFSKNSINLVTVARLVPQKAIDRFIEVHSKLINKGLKHEVYVIGDGPEKEKLEKSIKENKVENSFHLLGKKENPYPYIKNADYFCLLSNFEGYGMVLEEAKILGKNIIITNTAAREAVEDYKNSIILENSKEGIYNGLKEILKEKKQGNIEISQLKEYDNSKIIGQVVELIES